jgi:hypothetical protein
MASGLALIAIITGVLTNAISLFSTYEYQKETIREARQNWRILLVQPNHKPG